MKCINPFLFLLAAANIFGVVVGLLVYYPQIAASNPLLWVFIPDCPLYVLLAALFYAGLLRNELLRTITALGLLKYGIWTLFALFSYSGYFLVDWFGWLLVIEHIGMSSQFALFSKEFDKRYLLVGVGWFLLNDFADYVLGVHPFLPSNDLGGVVAFTAFLSLAVPAFALFAGKRIGEEWIVKQAKAFLGL
ncbi:Uncharacterised protein [uncultured archaeon]|nr:Uncharacterised protein [uncultured archaeon]